MILSQETIFLTTAFFSYYYCLYDGALPGYPITNGSPRDNVCDFLL